MADIIRVTVGGFRHLLPEGTNRVRVNGFEHGANPTGAAPTFNPAWASASNAIIGAGVVTK